MMDEEVGEIEYDADARLYFGATKYSDKSMPLELHALIQDKSSDNDLEKSEQEARYIAEQVKYIIEHKQVYDMKSETYRQATFKDIVIFERGLKMRAIYNKYLKTIIFRSM